MPRKVYFSIGKKKTAVARAIIVTDKTAKGFVDGGVFINGVPLEKYGTYMSRKVILDPLRHVLEEIPDLLSGIMIVIDVRGGGYMSQAVAARTALFNVLRKYTTKKKTFVKKAKEYDEKIFISDPRRAEPKKFGGPGARARFQKSYR